MKRGLALRLLKATWWCICASIASLCLSSTANAQINAYSNTTTGAIVDATNPVCTPVFARTFSVATSYVVADVDVGVLLSHTYRSDLRVTIKSPGGTIVQLITNSGAAADNLNVLFSDEAATAISTHATNDSTGPAPAYQRTFKPQSLLSAFDGQNALGTWQLEVCDTVTQDSGTFTRSDLYITPVGAVLSDLSTTKTVNNAAPASGSNITYTLGVSNAAGSATATGVTVTDLLPLGTTFVSATGSGTYNSGTGVWSVGTITAGQTLNLTITATVTASAGTTITNSAEVSASSNADPDSFVANGSTVEDDYAAVNFTVAGTRVAGTLPTLTCPVGTSLFDWDTRTWTAGSLSNSYAVTSIGNVGFAVSSSGTFVNDASFGGQTPALAALNTGGLSPAQLSLHQYLDFATISQTATTVITLPNSVPGAQFTVFDVDYAAASFADRLTVTGTLNGASVLPTLTNGTANYVLGNVAIGDITSANGSGNGNVGVTFSSAVDTITITYGNHTTAPADPTGQAIAIHDITFCNPMTSLSVTKTSASWNNGVNPVFDIPGNDVLYTINVANSGGGMVANSSFFIVDALPSQLTFFNGDADGAGPGTNPVIFTDSNSGLTWNYATDVGYATTAPTSFAQCNVTPAAGYAANVRYICLNPKGAMAAKNGAVIPSFSISLRARIN
jgi:uncharacterized repeat protein (TIGR01451 family)